MKLLKSRDNPLLLISVPRKKVRVKDAGLCGRSGRAILSGYKQLTAERRTTVAKPSCPKDDNGFRDGA